jgi:uncharacterized protein (TIGR00251 family)
LTELPDLNPALQQTPDGVIVRVYVQPKARREQLIGMHADRLKLAVTEPPDKGKANAAVIRLLSSAVQLPPSQIELLRGATSRQKDVLLRLQQVEEVASLLMSCLVGHG